MVYAVSSTFTDPLGGQYASLGQIFAMIMNVVLGVGVALTVIFLILGGIKYITSQGDQKQTQQAREWLTNAVIGFIVVVAAYTIRTIVATTIGADTSTFDTDIAP